MTHQATIGERIGAPKFGYIDPKNREDAPRRSKDGDAMRSAIKAYIREHEGEYIRNTDIANALGCHSTNVMYHLPVMARTGQITIVAETKQRRRMYLGRKPKAGDRSNGPVETIKPAAPVSRSNLAKVNDEAWAYVRSLTTQNDPAAIGNQVVGIVGFVTHLERKLDEQIDSTQDNAPRRSDAEHASTTEVDGDLRGGTDDVPPNA